MKILNEILQDLLTNALFIRWLQYNENLC